MKYFSRLNVYKANNVVFHPDTLRAYSYGWWRFVDKINGYVVFNNYTYSNSTSKHQSKVRSLLNELGIEVDLYISTQCDLRGNLRYGQSSNVGLDALKDAYRKQDLKNAAKIQKVFKVKMSQKDIDSLYTDLEEELCNAYLFRALKYQIKQEKKQKQELKRKLEDFLENEVKFRDYDIEDESSFGQVNKVAVHQKVDAETLEQDVQNALYDFQRDGFGSIVFYI